MSLATTINLATSTFGVLSTFSPTTFCIRPLHNVQDAALDPKLIWMLWERERYLLLPEIETGFYNILKPSPVTIVTELSRTVQEEDTKQKSQKGKITKISNGEEI
jgi:hypothetical protein